MSVREEEREDQTAVRAVGSVSSSKVSLETHAQAEGAGSEGTVKKRKKAFRVENAEVGFQQLWSLYRTAKTPSNVSSKKAHEQWLIAIQKDEPDAIYQGLLKAVDYQKAQQKKDGWLECIPDLFRWLRDEKWLDAREASGFLTVKERAEEEYQRQCAETLRKLEAGEFVFEDDL